MPVMRQVRDDEPLMVAWKAYCQGEDYRNTFKWASIEKHRDGSLWAAFMAGFHAANPPQETVEAIRWKAISDVVSWLRLPDAKGSEEGVDWADAMADCVEMHFAALKPEQLNSTLNEVG